MPGRSMKILKVIEGLKSWNMPHAPSNPISKRSVDIDEFLKSEDFSYKSLVTHGFPCEPNCIAFDPIQKLLAIGTKNGRIKIFGKSEVDYTLSHFSDSCVLQIIFLVNTGQFLSICQDDIIHLWNIKTNPPEIVGSIQFKRERISTAYLSLKSDWLYVGTERGNVNFVNTKTFTTSGYVINWNKAIEITQSVHPGKVIKIAENPQDNNKILIGYSSGVLTLWDLKARQAEARFKYSDNLFGFSWNFEGKSFMTCHSNGILAIWNTKQPPAPVSIICPHSCNESLPTDSQLYEPIHSVEWIGTQNGEPFVIFSGGGCLTPLPDIRREDSDQKTQSFVNPLPSITVMRGKRLAVMQMDFNVVDFTTLCESPYDCDPMEPYAVSVLLESDLVVIDLLSQNYPSFENPYAIDIHISPVTAIEYVSDCPKEFIFGLYMTPKACSMMRNRSAENTQSSSSNQQSTPSPNPGNNEASQNDGSSFSNREWPINGGSWTKNSNQMNDNNSEIIITGHADGSIKFWNANGLSLVSVYKFRTCKLFKMNKSDWSGQKQALAKRATDTTTTQNSTVSNSIVNNHFSPGLLEMEDYPLAIKFIQFCHESRKILLGSLASVILLKFIKDDVTEEIPFMDINSTLENFDDFYTGNNTQNDDDVMASPSEMKTFQPGNKSSNKRTTSQSSYPSNSSYENKDLRVFLLLKTGNRHWSRGYQPELVCRLGVPSLSFELTSVGGANNNANNCVLPPSNLTTVSFNSSFGLLAFGNESGVIIVDYNQKSIILQIAINDLYENIRPVREISRDNSGLDSFMNENSNPPPGSPYASGSNSGKLCFVAKNAIVRGELKRAKSQGS